MMQTKAIYNLLRLTAKADGTIPADDWAVEDLRIQPIQKLFERLEKMSIKINKQTFQQFAENCDTPEDLADLLLPDGVEEKVYDQTYLLIFELWRRLFPERQSLSIFCDELDHRIALYDQENLESDEQIQDALANMLEILDENVDAGAAPHEIFLSICDFCAHGLESFLYEYISDVLDSGNTSYAAELTFGFAPFVAETIWFDFLRVRLLSSTDIEESNQLLHQVLQKECDESLLLEILNYLTVSGEHALFCLCMKKILPFLTTSEELSEVMEIAAEYYNRLDHETAEQAIQKLIKKQKKGPLDPVDLKALTAIVTK